MKRAIHSLVALAVALTCVSVPATAHASTAPNVYVPSARIMTMDGGVLWQRRPSALRRPASTIKMLNALVVRERVSDLDKVITVSKRAEKIDDGDVGLKAGQKLTVRQLLKIMLIPSANDAAEALADGIGGSQKKYVALMNAKAKALGLKHTRAYDPHGLSDRDTSTAADLSVLARQVMADPVLRSIVGTRRVKVPRRGGKSVWYSSTDLLLGKYKGIEGVKTGYTDPAGYCFIGAAKRNGVELLGVVLGAHSLSDRFSQMRKLLDWGFAHTKAVCVVSSGQKMGAVGVSDGTTPTVAVHAEKSVTVVTAKALGAVITQVVLPASVAAPVSKGQRLGTVEVLRSGKLVASANLVADVPVGSAPATTAVAAQTTTASMTVAQADPSLWTRIAEVVAGVGRMLGI